MLGKLSHLFARQDDSSSSGACYALMNGTNLYQRHEDTPCGPSINGVSVCCSKADVCMGDGICHFTAQVPKLSGYYTGACTDPTFEDPSCPKQCTQFTSQDIVYNSTSNDWACCYNHFGETVDCTQPRLTATFEATPQPSLKIEGIAPGTPAPVPPPTSSSSSAVASTTGSTYPVSIHKPTSNPSPTISAAISTSSSTAIALATPVFSTANPFPVDGASSTATSSASINSSQHSVLGPAAIAAISVIGALLLLSVTLFIILLCCRRRHKRRKALAFAEQKHIDLPPNGYQQRLDAKRVSYPGSPMSQYNTNRSPIDHPTRPYNINTDINYTSDIASPTPVHTYPRAEHPMASELGYHSYYGQDNKGAGRKVIQESPLSELGGDEWQTELDGRRKHSTYGESPVIVDRWRDKKLPTPGEEEDVDTF